MAKRRLGIFMRHFEKQQKGQLLQIIAVAHAVVAQRMAEIPDFLDQGGGVHNISFLDSEIIKFS